MARKFRGLDLHQVRFYMLDDPFRIGGGSNSVTAL